jgi:hypothetical protein
MMQSRLNCSLETEINYKKNVQNRDDKTTKISLPEKSQYNQSAWFKTRMKNAPYKFFRNSYSILQFTFYSYLCTRRKMQDYKLTRKMLI